MTMDGSDVKRRRTAGRQSRKLRAAEVEAKRERVWELHLRGVPKSRIAKECDLSRDTVASLIAECYAEVQGERVEDMRARLAGAIARMRRVQEQAYRDHDADDERELSVLALMTGGGGSAEGVKGDEKARGRVMARYQSQRSQYLRVILDAEKEIARLEGLYESLADESGAVLFRIVGLAQGAQISSSAHQAANSEGGVAAPSPARGDPPTSEAQSRRVVPSRGPFRGGATEAGGE